MSASAGGCLVVTNRAGRDVKRYPLLEGAATLGSDAACDVRLTLPDVSAHHATVSVHANQAMVRSVSERETLVNGAPVSVAALQHNDVIALGGLELRWEYSDPAAPRQLAPEPALHQPRPRSRSQRRGSEPPPRDPIVTVTRASMPAQPPSEPRSRSQRHGSEPQETMVVQARASMSGPTVTVIMPKSKQVAVVQPQRREATSPASTAAASGPRSSANRSRTSRTNAPSVSFESPTHTHVGRITIRVYTDSDERAPDTSGRERTAAAGTSNDASLRSTHANTHVWPFHRNCQQCKRANEAQIVRQATVNAITGRRRMVLDGSRPKTVRFVNCEQCGQETGGDSQIADDSQNALNATAATRQTQELQNGAVASNSARRATVAETANRTVVRTRNKSRRTTGNAAEISRGVVTSTPVNTRRSAQQGSRPNLADTTKATLWIESRKTSPRKATVKRLTKTPLRTPKKTPVKAAKKTSDKTPVKTPVSSRNTRRAVSAKKPTPLRMVLLKKAHSAQKPRVTKIQAPRKMDSTKQAAIMLMARHTPKSKQPSPNKGPSYVVKKRSPIKTPKRNRSSRKITATISPTTITVNSHPETSASRGASPIDDLSLIEVSDNESHVSLRNSEVSRRSRNSSLRSPQLRDSGAGPSHRSTETGIIDGSNLDNTPLYQSSVADVSNQTSNYSHTIDSEPEISLHYSDSSITPSPRRSIHSRSSRRLEDTRGTLTPQTQQPTPLRSAKLQPSSSVNDTKVSTYSLRTSRSVTDRSLNSTSTPARRTRSVSPRASRSHLESYSVVDLVSDSNDSIATRTGSVYNSANSDNSAVFDTPEPKGQRSTVASGRLTLATPADLRFSTPERKMRGSSTRTASRKDRVTNQSTLTNISAITPENTEEATKNITMNSTRISRASKRFIQSDTYSVEGGEEDSSPISSKRKSKRSQGTPSMSNNISTNENVVDTPVMIRGDHTPENQHSPVEASTPVLSIQSLLDAHQNSIISPNSGSLRKSKRKTIGVLRSEPRKGRTGPRSKSVLLPIRSRNISANFDASIDSIQNDGEEVVTPKSAAKPVPEGVKNKHSSAKKPLSKRSLIDNLNESDIVKQLFNSPVKRKLSQSMTEFSKRHLLNDGDRPRRPTRATIAAVGGATDSSLLDNTAPFTPGAFVSPLSTPRNSPNMTGINRLFRNITPKNDLQDVRGVRNLLKTPRTRKSIRNDLNNVSGVNKAVVAKSPRTGLNIRIKKIFAASPKNDLRRVSGVRELFQSRKKTNRSPKNELDDLRGVRNLFKKGSPRNDLRNVSGVKKTIRRNSPRNDLSDVKGVKLLFRQEKQRNDLNDVSGVEQLFNESGNLDSTFDQLLGRPQIKAVYTKSKSFTTASKIHKKGKNRLAKARSLRESISLITENVEEWLQKELKERLHKNSSAVGSATNERKSLNKSKNLIREMQKLNTDTIGGSAPVIVNRTRNSSIVDKLSNTTTRKKSASELYGAHMLPIKKRSLVEASINKSGYDRSHKLPIKKRAVVHSTPVKGSVNVTMNASQIGRISPISSKDKTAELEALARIQSQESLKTKSPVDAKTIGTSTKDKSLDIVKPSPKKTRSGKAAQSSPVVARTRRGRKSKNENQEVLNVRKRRTSIVITKKPPVLSPEPKSSKVTRRGRAALPEREKTPKISPKKTRSTRGQKSQVNTEVKANTPKKSTRAKVRRNSVIVTKPSPKINPRSTSNRKGKIMESQEETQPQAKRTRKIVIAEPELQAKNKTNEKSSEGSQAVVQTKRQTRKTGAANDKTAIEQSILTAQTRRTRKAAVEIVQIVNADKNTNSYSKRTRNVAQNKTAQESKPPLKNRKAQASAEPKDTVAEPTTGRRHRTAVKEPATKTLAKGRRNNAETNTKVQQTKGRKTKQDIPVDDKKPAADELPAARGRKRKNVEQEDPVTEENAIKKTTRSTRAAAKEDNARVKVGKRGAGGATDDKQKISKPSETRTRRAKNVENDKPVKGKKVTAVADSALQGGGRKKRTNMELSDVKDNMKEPAKRPRRAAAAALAASNKPAERRRR